MRAYARFFIIKRRIKMKKRDFMKKIQANKNADSEFARLLEASLSETDSELARIAERKGKSFNGSSKEFKGFIMETSMK